MFPKGGGLPMRKMLSVSAALLGAALLSSAPASAGVIFNLENAVFTDGRTLTGWFETSDDFSELLDLFLDNEMSSYTLTNLVSWDPTSGLNVSRGPFQLTLLFEGELTASGVALATKSYEFILAKPPTGGNKYLSSGRITASVPEPATWGLMFGGLCLVGAATMRRRTTSASHA